MQFAQKMKKLQEEASAALSLSKDLMKKAYDKGKKAAVEYAEGDLVWIESTNIRTDRPSRKLDDKRYGPFPVIKKIGNSAYKIKIPRSWKGVHPVYNEALLTPYQAPEFPNQEAEKKVPELAKTFEAKVEAVLDSRVRRGGMQYLIKWEGKPRSENTWEPRSQLLKQYKTQLTAFHQEHPDAPRMPTITVPGGLRNIKLSAKEQGVIDTRAWERWTRVQERWDVRDARLEAVQRISDADIERINNQEVKFLTFDACHNIGKSWLFSKERNLITHAVILGEPHSQNHHWWYPILSFHHAAPPLPYNEPIGRNTLFARSNDRHSFAVW